MPDRTQVVKLVLLGLMLWTIAMLSIRLTPDALLDPALANITFATTPLAAWVSVLLVRAVAELAAPQLVSGIGVVGAVAMVIDGAVLHWAPGIYGDGDRVVRIGAAWLLWGYGLSLGIALLMARRTTAGA